MALRWVKNKWFWLTVVGIAILAVVRHLLTRTPNKAIASAIKREFEAIDAQVKTRQLAKILGAEKAAASVQRQYKDTISVLEAEQKTEIERLKSDPIKLARFLVRVGK